MSEFTGNLIGNSFRAFLMYPDEWERVRSQPDEMAETAVEECLRFDGPL